MVNNGRYPTHSYEKYAIICKLWETLILLDIYKLTVYFTNVQEASVF